MDRSQLIEALAAHYEGNRQAAAKALDSVVDTITREVSKGERVVITGFGAFEKAIRPARTVRDPATGEPVPGGEIAVPRFHPGANLKAVVAGVRALPALTLATAAHAAAAVTETAARAAGLGARKPPDEPGVVPSPSDDAVSGSAPFATAKGRSAAAPAARKPPARKSPAAEKPPARKSSPRQAGLDPTESTASFAPPALAEEMHSGQATQATAAAATSQPAPPTAVPELPGKRAPARKAAAKATPSKTAVATAPAEATAKQAAAKKTVANKTAAKQPAARTAAAKKTATKSDTKTTTRKAGTKKTATKKPARASAESTDGLSELSLPAALAEPPPPDTSSRPVLSLGPDTATETETETETGEATGPADLAQPGQS